MTNKHCLSYLFSVSALLFLTACSSVFYYPTPFPPIDYSKTSLKVEVITFESEDGTKLNAWYVPAKGKAIGKIIHFHGNAQNLANHSVFLRNAPNQGFDYFIFDYRGYGNSEGTPTPKGLIKDGKAAMRWVAKKRPDLPLIVMGQSLGGAVAMSTLLELNGEVPVKLIVIDSSFSSYRSAARNIMMNNWITWPFHPLAWLIIDNSTAPGDKIKNLSPVPVLVVHGDKDQVVAYRFGEEIYKNLKEPKEFWHISGGYHTDFLYRSDWEAKFYSYLKGKLK